MRLSDAILFAIALAAAAGLAWSLVRLRQLVLVGSAYKVKVLATLIFSSGRAIDPLRAEEVSADTYRPMRLFRTRVDHTAQTVTVALFGFRPRRTAVHRPGFGATLASRHTRSGLTVVPPPATFGATPSS